MKQIILIILAIYFINFFYGLKVLFKCNYNLSNVVYTFVLVIIFPFLTPFVYLFTFFDDQIRIQLVKKKLFDKNNQPDINQISITQHNELSFFSNGDLLFDDIFEEINRAEKYIHLSFFSFNTDQIGKKLIKKLEEKLLQNVEVKILYDPLGSYKIKMKYFKNFKKLGGELVPFLKIKKKYFNINYRNHRKILIIDNKISYIGGFNIGDKYLGRNQKLGLWVDSELKIIGQATTEIEKRFLADYLFATKKELNIESYLIPYQFDGNKQIEIISSGADVHEINYIENKFLEHIYHAEQYIYIQTPYLILNDAMMRALKYAALKGVQIQIMLPNKNDHPFVLQATKAYASNLVEENIQVYLFNKNAFLHSKVFICDDHYISIGTTNQDIRSFKFDLEINSFISDRQMAQYMKEVFLKQITYCTLYTKEMILKTGPIKKLYYNMCKLLSTIL